MYREELLPYGESWRLPIPEVSGLGKRKIPHTESTEMLAVGDRTSTIVRIMVDQPARTSAGMRPQLVFKRQEVKRLPSDLDGSGRESNWEGVAGDASGHMFIVCERTSELLVLAPDFTFARRVPLRHKHEHARHGLESLLLLRGGHLLVATQRDPVALLEFGRSGDQPLGLSADSVLPAGTPMQLPQGELVAVSRWKVYDHRLRSINDLAAHDGEVYAVSSKSRCVARLSPLAPGAPGVSIADDPLLLPHSIVAGHDAKAEGLLVHTGLGLLVAVDTHDNSRDNLYRLRGIVGPPSPRVEV